MKFPRVAHVAVAFIAALVVSIRPATSQTAPSENSSKVSPAPDSATAKAKTDPQPAASDWGFKWEDHPTLYFGHDTHVDFRARVQADVRDSEAAVGDSDAFDVARKRIGVEGRIAGVVDFQVEGELGADDPWRDVYVDYRQYQAVQVQAGQFKLPFSLDENTSSTNLDFVYRSRAATQLAPGRDAGAMVHGRIVSGIVRYELGLFAHDGDNAQSNDPERVSGDRTVAGRVTVQPYRSRKSVVQDLQVGIAFTNCNVPEGFPSLRGRTAMNGPLFSPELWVQGTRQRVGLEARWRPGPFSVKAEYMRVTSERRSQSVEDTDLSPLLGTGWYVSGTWVATGQKKAGGLDNPRHTIFNGGFGTIELAARIEKLAFGSTASGIASDSPRADVVLGNSDRATTLGVNWYIYRGIKVQANVIRETISDPSRGPLPSQPTFWSRVVRFQFTL